VKSRRIVISGGGAAGFFAAITCAEAAPDAEVVVLERGPHLLAKVKISGGGRCNITHACFDERSFAAHFPRGERALIAPFKQFQARDTVAWFTARGVPLKTESDGRMFPSTDSSQTIIDCLLNSARKAGVKLMTNCGVERITKKLGGGFEVRVTAANPPHEPPPLPARRHPLPRSERGRGKGEGALHGSGLQSANFGWENSHPDPLPFGKGEGEFSAEFPVLCDKVLLATGGCRTPALGQLAVSLGHTLKAPVPSLFTFHLETPWLRQLAGVSLEKVEASVGGTRLCERGALLLTHWGLSGPVILRLSAWGARELHNRDYRFPLLVNWLPDLNAERITAEIKARRGRQPARRIANSPIAPLPARLWEQLVLASGVASDTRWSALSRAAQHKLIQQMLRTEFQVTGKSLNKDEFVTCGGVTLSEVNFKTMESRICPGLFFAGEVLDIDGLTGGFNFQAAWTTGWLAGRALAHSGNR